MFLVALRLRGRPVRWGRVALLGGAIGLARAALATAGWIVVERTGGPLQVPAYALALLSWPEAALLGPHRGPASPGFFLALGVLLTASTALALSGIVLAARAVRERAGARGPGGGTS